MTPTFFIAGIIQGSHQGKRLHDQEYRSRLRRLLLTYCPQAEIISPFDLHPCSIEYDDEKGKQTFLQMIHEATRSDVLVAYLPEASLGTAIEMWECYKRGIPIWTISPMLENWVVRFLSTHVFSSIQALEDFLRGRRFA